MTELIQPVQCRKALPSVSHNDTCIPYRILLLRREAAELLVEQTDEGYLLPSVEIPRGERATERLNAEVRRRFGISAYCLFRPIEFVPPPAFDGQESCYQVMESTGDDGPAPGEMMWLPTEHTCKDSFAVPNHFVALSSSLKEIHRHHHGHTVNPFTCPGWLDGLQRWVQKEIAPLGLRLTGGIRQLNSGAHFALVRMETNGTAVWFKATGEPNRHERMVSLKLANLFPTFVPQLVSVHPEWNGWLAIEAEGPLLDESCDIATWQRVARELADLQIESLGHTQALLNAGSKDTRTAALKAQIEPFLDAMAELMMRQTKIPPRPLTRSEIGALGQRIRRACTEMEELAVPDALGHLDFNPGNIVVGKDGCVVLDWAEACVGNPLVTFEYLRSHFRRTNAAGSDQQLISAYLDKWAHVVGADSAAKAWQLTPLMAVYTFAVVGIAWRDSNELRNPRIAGYLRSLTRRMGAEAALLEERGSGRDKAGE